MSFAQKQPPKCETLKHNWRDIGLNQMVCLTCQTVCQMGGLLVTAPPGRIEWAGGHWENGKFIPDFVKEWKV